MFRLIGGIALTGVVLALLLAASGEWLHSRQSTTPRSAPTDPAGPAQMVSIGEILPTADWIDRIFGLSRPAPPVERPLPETSPSPVEGQASRIAGNRFRTLCVRLCDGFYFPISDATPRERLAHDAQRCAQSCPTGSRLFVHRNPGEDVDDMIDLEGRPYRSLPTAFVHRTQYVADCTCRGNPWDEAALARHRAYAQATKPKPVGKSADKSPLNQTDRDSRRHRWARTE
jgi:uncharacterized protein DUF2865